MYLQRLLVSVLYQVSLFMSAKRDGRGDRTKQHLVHERIKITK
ncbi:hypothetical protein [Sivoneniella epilithica]